MSGETTYLIDDATPPRRMGEGCSVKEMSFANGGSRSGEGVARRNSRPSGICRCRASQHHITLTCEPTHRRYIGENRSKKVEIGVRIELVSLPFQEDLEQNVQCFEHFDFLVVLDLCCRRRRFCRIGENGRFGDEGESKIEELE